MSVLAGLRRVAKGESNLDLVGRARTWFTISAIVILISLVGIFVRQLNLGLAFKGGSSFTVPVAAGTKTPPVPDISDALAEIGVTGAEVQIAQSSSGQENIVVEARTGATAPEEQRKVAETLAKLAGQPDQNSVSIQAVGPKWGQQISNKALRGLIVFLVLVTAYISLRFEPKMAGASLAALLHDLLSTAGIYALVGLEVTPATVIAILTILGFSLYDTVVVFDKIRENTALLGTASASRTTYAEMVNRSVNQVMMRSINTSIASLLPVAGLLFVGAFLLGAETLKDLALALFIGTAVSTYSSIFVASPILAIWKEREPRYRQLKARYRAAAAGPRVAMAGGGSVSTGSVSSGSVSPAEAVPDGEERPSRQPMQVRRPAGGPRGRKRRGGKRRR